MTAVYTLDSFLTVARRRAQEARALLDVPKKRCDGAVACALLAAECSLKTTLLFGYEANTHLDVPGNVFNAAFKSKSGHNLQVLWGLHPLSITQLATTDEFKALSILHALDRYEHRYGAKGPERQHAIRAVDSADILVKWMAKVVT